MEKDYNIHDGAEKILDVLEKMEGIGEVEFREMRSTLLTLVFTYDKYYKEIA